jgi:UPF0755 protein
MMSMRISVRTGVIVVVLLGMVASVGIWFYQHTRSWLHAPIAQLSETVVYEVPRGAALVTVLNDLKKRGIIEHPRELSAWVKYMRPGFTLKAGEYEIQAGMSPVDIATLFDSGKVVLHKVTIVEGTTVKDLRRLLADQATLRITTDQLSNTALMKQLKSGGANGKLTHPEGQFFPDTYVFPKGTTDFDILRMANDRMRKELDRAWSERDPGLPLANAYEALILASIVEKETALGTERPMIAGVFVERLRKGMRLQTDPTVIYGIGDSYDGNIRKSDLLRDTPYNTYTRPGLPPTPICLPGVAALNAVVHPEKTEALFFVATGRGDGSHYFSRTLEEHNAALRRYLNTLRQH